MTPTSSVSSSSSRVAEPTPEPKEDAPAAPLSKGVHALIVIAFVLGIATIAASLEAISVAFLSGAGRNRTELLMNFTANATIVWAIAIPCAILSLVFLVLMIVFISKKKTNKSRMAVFALLFSAVALVASFVSIGTQGYKDTHYPMEISIATDDGGYRSIKTPRAPQPTIRSSWQEVAYEAADNYTNESIMVTDRCYSCYLEMKNTDEYSKEYDVGVYLNYHYSAEVYDLSVLAELCLVEDQTRMATEHRFLFSDHRDDYEDEIDAYELPELTAHLPSFNLSPGDEARLRISLFFELRS